MASPPTSSAAVWDVARGFRAEYRAAARSDPKVAEAMKIFNENKRFQRPLPKGMRDHKLDGPLKGYSECHLSGDVLLVYRPLPDRGMRLLKICSHADLKGPKGKALAKKLREIDL